MDSERTYSEDEVNAILDLATEAQTSRASTSSGATGLTLRELKEIGHEVGISEADIVRAATSLDRPSPAPTTSQKFLGQTIGVGRAVDLPRPLSDAEWHRLVVDLRQTFDAKGKLQEDGPFRQWTNSNLQAMLEPSETGQQLRLRTLKGNARTFQGMGLGFMAGGLGLGVLSVLGMARDPSDVLIFGVMGTAAFLGSRLTVPTWARTRADQFDGIIDRLLHRLENTALESGSRPESLEAPDGENR